MSEALSQALRTYRFTDALHALDDRQETDAVKSLVYALNAVFGNGGEALAHGYIGEILNAALASICLLTR